jgi:predicted amidophosphoribosyltransferase
MHWNDLISEADFRGAERWPTWICKTCQRECDYYLTGDICDQCAARMEDDSEHQRRLSLDVSQSR